MKQRPDVGTQRALCFAVEAFKDLFSFKILLQEREAPDQTFLKHGFKGAICSFPSHPVSAHWGLGQLSLGFRGGSTPLQAPHEISSAPDPA